MLPVGGNPPLHNFCPFIFCWFADSQRTFYHDRPYDLVAFAGCYHREIPTILEIPFSALVYCQSCVAVRTFLMLALRVRLPLMTAFGAGYNLLGGFMPDMIDAMFQSPLYLLACKGLQAHARFYDIALKFVFGFHNQKSNNEGCTWVSFFAVGLFRLCNL